MACRHEPRGELQYEGCRQAGLHDLDHLSGVRCGILRQEADRDMDDGEGGERQLLSDRVISDELVIAVAEGSQVVLITWSDMVADL